MPFYSHFDNQNNVLNPQDLFREAMKWAQQPTNTFFTKWGITPKLHRQNHWPIFNDSLNHKHADGQVLRLGNNVKCRFTHISTAKTVF